MCNLALSLTSKRENKCIFVDVGPTVPLLACEIQPRSLPGGFGGIILDSRLYVVAVAKVVRRLASRLHVRARCA